jgi:hypothetical protein
MFLPGKRRGSTWSRRARCGREIDLSVYSLATTLPCGFSFRITLTMETLAASAANAVKGLVLEKMAPRAAAAGVDC